MKKIADVAAAHLFLRENGASERLLQHATLVGEASEALIQQFQRRGINLDATVVRVGAALHDTGKIVHPEELNARGNRHEGAGKELLLRCGCDPALARICVSHAQWQNLGCSLEELIIALADNLWKGKRNEALEARVVETVAQLLAEEKWAVFCELDTCFEAIAAKGAESLQATQHTL